MKTFKPLTDAERFDKLPPEAFGRSDQLNPMLPLGMYRNQHPDTDPNASYYASREPAPVVNPKEGAGAAKPPVWSVTPRWIMLLVGRVMQIGSAKYDAFNYRVSNVSAMTYVEAMERHLQLWQDGEDDDEETGVSHLASVIASCTILLDAQANGSLGDNRQKTGMARKTLDMLTALAASTPLPPKNPNAPSMQANRLAELTLQNQRTH